MFSDLISKLDIPEGSFVRVHVVSPDGKRLDSHDFGQRPRIDLEVEEAVIEEIRKRRDAGRKKYGVSMERDDLTVEQWIQHSKEEALDFAIYLEKLKRENEAREVRLRAALEALLQAKEEICGWRKAHADEASRNGSESPYEDGKHVAVDYIDAVLDGGAT